MVAALSDLDLAAPGDFRMSPASRCLILSTGLNRSPIRSRRAGATEVKAGAIVSLRRCLQFFPLHRYRYVGASALCPQRVDANDCLEGGVLASVDEDLPRHG